METLNDKEQTWAEGRSWRGAVLAVVGLAWLAGLGFDWMLRFTWYGWQQRLIFRPSAVRTLNQSSDRYVTNEVPGIRGGDLTRLVGIRSFNARFEQDHPGGPQTCDGAGFRNLPAPPDLAHPVVVVGDSFMAAGDPMTNMFAVQLAERSVLPVYNRAMVGVGPFLSVERFVDSDRFQHRRPKILVWGFVERSVIQHGFSSLLYQLDIRDKGLKPAENYILSATTTRVVWQALLPGNLKTALPDTSALAQLSQRAWNRIRYALFGKIMPEVFAAAGDVAGKPILFYRPALDLSLGDPFERDPDQIMEGIRYTSDFMARRGIRLVILMIPDKETTYRERIPPAELGGRELPPSCLLEIERRLRAENIPVVNLVEPFRERAARGELLYWPDDTHWNSAGIRIAAELVWRELQSLPETQALLKHEPPSDPLQ
ncbi:MAG TPA: hypothetical protein P5567_03590 [Kiritimatiellia bacterium]|nr:hypothetical protein [Kiritimatiellia bacterium]HRZ11519.1 hypothetical protein [Kiritimatiellia bacterium]HSA16930.1 hypothetical protein [Kiritimatiellia bacterium]